jgi:GNAT superfamily N-acetyltransferase
MPHETQHAGCTISDDPARLDIAAIHAYLTRAYWSEGIPREVVARAVAHSLCLGLYAPDGAQIGLVRIVTDRATYGYLCDVYVLEAWRGRGLARAAVQHLLAHPDLQGLRRFQLVTRDAHPLYAQFGFAVVADPERHMEKRLLNAYRRQGLPIET